MKYQYYKVLPEHIKEFFVKATNGKEDKVKALKQTLGQFLACEEDEYKALKDMADEVDEIIKELSDDELLELIEHCEE